MRVPGGLTPARLDIRLRASPLRGSVCRMSGGAVGRQSSRM